MPKNKVSRFLPFYPLISEFQASSHTPKGRTFRALSIDIENSSFHALWLGIENLSKNKSLKNAPPTSRNARQIELIARLARLGIFPDCQIVHCQIAPDWKFCQIARLTSPDWCQIGFDYPAWSQLGAAFGVWGSLWITLGSHWKHFGIMYWPRRAHKQKILIFPRFFAFSRGGHFEPICKHMFTQTGP